MSAANNKTISVNLTEDQCHVLISYILMTTQHRKDLRDTWEELSKERNEDGTPKFKHAASNAEYYDELEQKLDEIRRTIDSTY